MSESILAETFREAMRISDRMKFEGASKADRQAMVETALRQAWPQVRAWRYLCENCNDYGLKMHDCPGDATCGRSMAHLPHEYGRPCWCDAGRKFRPKAVAPEDLEGAGRAPKKSKPFTRFGR